MHRRSSYEELEQRVIALEAEKSDRNAIRVLKNGTLRGKAEEFIKQDSEASKEYPSGDPERLIEELRLYQAELEIQNEELQLAQLALEEALGKYTDLYDFAPLGYFTISLKGMITGVNLTGASILGVERALLISKPFSNFISRDDQDAYYNHSQRLIKTKDKQTFELVLVTRDEIPFNAQMEWFPVVDKHGRLTKIRAAVTDITHIMARAKKTAETAIKAKNDFLAKMTHEIRTPLHNILGFSYLGEKYYATEDRSRLLEYNRIIKSSGEVLLSLLNNLLDQAKFDSYEMIYNFREINLSQLIRSVVIECESLLIKRKLSLTFFDTESSTLLTCDQRLISQVVHNLLNNATKFSPKKGQITIQIVQKHDEIITSVTDQGKGIPDGELNAVFEKFFQSSKNPFNTGGTGLGLSICQEIIKGHHGRIWAENSPNGGAKFSFVIPKGSKQK